MADDGFQFVSQKKASKRRNRTVAAKKAISISSDTFDALNEDEFDKLEALSRDGM